MDLVVECYRSTGDFPKEENFGLTSQIRRAAVSIPANIAEGHTRRHTKEYLQHLSIAHGSLAELETHLQISGRLGYLKNDRLDGLLRKADEIGRMVNGLKKSLEKRLK